MRWFVLSGRVADLAIVLAVAEWVALTLRHRQVGGLSGSDMAANLLAGIFLLLALRASLTGAAWPWIAAALAGAGAAHIADLLRRLASRAAADAAAGTRPR